MPELTERHARFPLLSRAHMESLQAQKENDDDDLPKKRRKGEKNAATDEEAEEEDGAGEAGQEAEDVDES